MTGNRLHRCQPLLGTLVEISLSGDYSDLELIRLSQQGFDDLRRIQDLMSFHSLDSELSNINRLAVGHSHVLSEDMKTVLNFGLELSLLSHGLYDFTIASKLVEASKLPDHGFDYDLMARYSDLQIQDDLLMKHKPLLIDLGGIAKGYAVDVCLMRLESVPGLTVTVNAGGDLRMNAWREESVGIKLPCSESLQLNVPMIDAALATSADYYLDSGSVMVRPESFELVDSPKSYSVFASTCMVADALTKLVYLGWDQTGLSSIIERYSAVAFSVDADARLQPLI